MKANQEESDDDSDGEEEKNKASGKTVKEILRLTKQEMMDIAKKEVRFDSLSFSFCSRLLTFAPFLLTFAPFLLA